MAASRKRAYTFTSQATAGDAFSVVSFRGEEGLSKLYRFTILLASRQHDLDLRAVVQNPACLTMEHDQGPQPFHGILESFEQLQQSHDISYFRAVLVPKLWWLTLTHHNQVFLDHSCPQLLEAVLQDGGLRSGKDFSLRLHGSYPSWDYVCQYRESHFNFVSRWMERYGLYYYFEQTEHGELMVITDNLSTHHDIHGGGQLRYSPVSGLQAPYANELVTSLHCESSLVPQSVLLRDLNYEKPGLEIAGTATVADAGQGEVYIFGEHCRTPEEARFFARMRAQSLACDKTVFKGEGTVSLLRCGCTFTLSKHFDPEANQKYLVTQVVHEANQTAYLSMNMEHSRGHKGLYYRNTFTAIPASVQFRPRRQTAKPRIHGVMNARIDAAGSGQYAELDDQGRYKVILPFDLSGRKHGHASSWLRMMQPYAGSDHGMHFPLHKGTEVLLHFIDGDPDRPFIAAAVPNPTHKSPVTSAGNTKCLLTTSGQNIMHIEDKKGSERILMRSPTAGTYMRLGMPNDPPSSKWEEDDEAVGFKLQTDDAFEVFAGSENEVIMIENSLTVGGGFEKLIALFATEITIGEFFTWNDPFDKKFAPLMSYLHGRVQRAVGEHSELNEQQLEIANDVLKMRQMKQKLTEQRTALTNTQQELTENRTSLTESIDQLNEDITEMAEQKELMTTSNEQLQQVVTDLQQSSISATQENTRMAENVTALRTERISLIQTRTRMGETRDALIATRDQLADELIEMVDIATRI